MVDDSPVDRLEAGVVAGDRASLARAITLIESSRTQDEATAEELLQRLLPHAGGAWRIGITGVPGVGKSTFIEALGTCLTGMGRNVAVLAVDPSSSVTGGSILGDKTRMHLLARDPRAFIRPTPGGRTPGGVARRTREAMLLCEAAGFDVVLIETIGVGQSEVAVRDMVDFFLLLALAGAGDELQGIKRGVIELADAIAVTKADGDNAERAAGARSELELALHLLYPSGGVGWRPPVLTCSAKDGTGLDDVWQAVERHRAEQEASGAIDERRSRQALAWVDRAVEDLLRRRFERNPAVAASLPDLQQQVLDGTIEPWAAARRLVELDGAADDSE